MDLSDDDLQQRDAADRKAVDPPIEVQTATWMKAGQLDWWVKERLEWFGRVRGADGRQRWIRSGDLRPASGSQPWHFLPRVPTRRGTGLKSYDVH